jgi:hypothetical protein
MLLYPLQGNTEADRFSYPEQAMNKFIYGQFFVCLGT